MDLKEASVFELAKRLNEIQVEMNALEMERLKIVYELYERKPYLKDDVNLQPKKRVRDKEC